MSFWIVVDPTSETTLDYRCGELDNFEEDVSIRIKVLTSVGQKFSNKPIFLEFAQKYLHRLGVDWITVGSDQEICFINVDSLKNNLSARFSWPSWFYGNKRCLLGVSRSGRWAYSDTFKRLTQTGGTAEYDSYDLSMTVTETDYIETIEAIEGALLMKGASASQTTLPVEIQNSLTKFREDHPTTKITAFVLMKFGTTQAHSKILNTIQSTLDPYNIKVLRADMKEYHPELFANVQTYIHGCTFGIAVFERIDADDFNPNVSLEVGYMMALRKHICFLKDKSLKSLHTDLVARLYRTFDTHDPRKDIPKQLIDWLSDYSKQLGIPDPKQSTKPA